MTPKSIRLPETDLTAMKLKFPIGQGEFIRSVVAQYLADKSKIAKAIADILTGVKPPIDNQAPKGRTSVYLPDEALADLEESAARLGISLEALVGIALHAELEEQVDKC